MPETDTAAPADDASATPSVAAEAVIDTATGSAAPAEISERRVLSIFSEIAPAYERFNHLSSFGRDRAWLHTLVDAAPVTSESRVLDVAGGTGEVTFTLCAEKPPASVLLSDYTPAMLEQAQLRLDAGDACGVPVETMVVDAQHMPLPDDSFDVVTMAYGIRNMPDRMAALREINRVLRPGGTAVILEFSTPGNPLMRAGYRVYLRYAIPTWGQICCGNRADFVYLAKSISAFPAQREFASMLTRAGFVDVVWRNVTFGVAAVHIARKPGAPDCEEPV